MQKDILLNNFLLKFMYGGTLCIVLYTLLFDNATDDIIILKYIAYGILAVLYFISIYVDFKHNTWLTYFALGRSALISILGMMSVI